MTEPNVFDVLIPLLERSGRLPAEALVVWGEYCALCTATFAQCTDFTEAIGRIRAHAYAARRWLKHLLRWLEAGRDPAEWPGPGPARVQPSGTAASGPIVASSPAPAGRGRCPRCAAPAIKHADGSIECVYCP